MNKKCTTCGQSFIVSDWDLALIKKASPVIAGKVYEFDSPDQCPTCREQYRMAHRNEWNMYHRKCDLTGKQIISMYHPDAPFKVYDQDVWWSDQYDPLAYGRDIDFNRPFFEQMAELQLDVPKASIINAKSENCEFTNYSGENRNCYMVVGGWRAEDCYYSYRAFYATDNCDCYDIYKCERCYECSESANLYNCIHCTHCFESSNLFLCQDCMGCMDCFGCVNLRNKQHHIYNQPFSKEEYEKKVAELKKQLDLVRPDIEALHLRVPHRFAHQVQCEEVSGDQILQSKNCHDVYTMKNSRDCAFVRIAENSQDCMDSNFCDNCQLQYFNCNNEQNYGVAFSSLTWYSKHIYYCIHTINSEHLFGCTGMKKHKYCILNKQYTEQEYQELVPQLIAHMQETGEWSQFFPPSMSAFAYNETVANDYVPLSKDEVLSRNWIWRDDQDRQQEYMGPKTEVPENIEEVSDDITEQILTCEESGKLYRIIPQELRFYRSMNLPIPRRCPMQRHQDRMARLNPRKLWDRACVKCGKEMRSSYSPERKEIVYCEECYLNSLN